MTEPAYDLVIRGGRVATKKYLLLERLSEAQLRALAKGEGVEIDGKPYYTNY